MFSGGVSRRRGVTHIFRGCFDPTGYYAFFPGVFRAAGVLHTFPRGAHNAGVKHAVGALRADGVGV
jgi:hypothetical protein